MPRTIIAVSLSKREAILDDGTHVPVTNMFDEDRDDTEDPDACVSFVAGPDAEGMWYADRADGFRSALDG